jgi:hypothetical protein
VLLDKLAERHDRLGSFLSQIESMRNTYAETVGVTDMPGLGQQAFWMEESKGLQVLDQGLQLSISGDTDSGSARDLAAKALGRLK